jgi:glycosyltransferase involved in cell wall biosynthesis
MRAELRGTGVRPVLAEHQSRPMRVLHVYSGNLFGGIESILLSLARWRGFCPSMDIEVALCFEGRLSCELENTGVSVHRLPEVRVSRPHTVRRARRAVASLVRERTFDRVICHAPWAQAIFGRAIARAGVPLVFWAHDVMTGRHWTERWARRSRPDLVVCNSEFTARSLPALYKAVPATVIYAPVDVSPPRLSSPDRIAIRSALDTTADAVVVIQTSRAEAWKGHAVLLDALGRLRDVPNWIWWQVGGAQRPGEAAFLDVLRQSAARLGISDRVRFVGDRSDVPRLLAAADVYCQANIGPEPFGIAFVEALAAGLPVVATGQGGVLEIVDQTCGVLPAVGDSDALVRALRELICDASLRSRLSSAAPGRAHRLCDPETQVHRLADALCGIASKAVA